MQAYVLLCRLKQLRHMVLRQPDSLALKADIEFKPAILGAIDEELSVRWRILFGFHLKLPAKCLVEKRLFQGIQSSDFLSVDVAEAVGFVAESVK